MVFPLTRRIVEELLDDIRRAVIEVGILTRAKISIHIRLIPAKFVRPTIDFFRRSRVGINLVYIAFAIDLIVDDQDMFWIITKIA
ncbi:MAG: hypothetical protein ACOYKF_10025, partial [Phenylobacterium sp.]